MNIWRDGCINNRGIMYNDLTIREVAKNSRRDFRGGNLLAMRAISHGKIPWGGADTLSHRT